MKTVVPQRCVLIVEDEMCLAMMLEDILSDAGYKVLKAARLPGALALAASEAIDGAILDINLAGTQVFPVADLLARRRIPYMFASAYGNAGLPDGYRQQPVLEKPYGQAQLQQALATLLDGPVQ
jgi:CheY-like chemotaxis protein